MKRDERISLMRQKAREVVGAISPSANHLVDGDIDGGGTAMCVIYEDKKRLYMCETYILNDEAKCNLRLFSEV